MGDKKFYLVFAVSIFALVISLAGVLANHDSGCYQITSESSCNTNSTCTWKNDSWGSWCEELTCWNLYNQSSCTGADITGTNCTWGGSNTFSSCEEVSCWSFSGTDSNSCTSNYANKTCTWSDSCYSVGGTGCEVINTQSVCQNTTGCGWGACSQAGCWSYSAEASCNSGLDWEGKNCTWSSSGNYCKERSCFSWSDFPNETACVNAVGLNCEWKYGSCQEKNCWSFDFTNASRCVNNSIGESCIWDGKYCKTDDCWNSNTNASCSNKQGCIWSEWTGSGWCEERQCWNWDSTKGGNESSCFGNSTYYGLNCKWRNKTGVDDGWCEEDWTLTSTSCANFTSERSCFDSYYCWWQANDWNDASKGGNCSDPDWSTVAGVSSGILTDWNPGCYIFDLNSSKCESIIGCEFTAGLCQTNTTLTTHSGNITNTGITCSFVNESNLCNNIASLNSCCSWINGSCTNNYYSTACIDQLDQTPNGEVSCEDADVRADCDTIAGDPWYMPCSWNNVSNKCIFKSTSVFGNTSKSLIKIENKRNCDAAGGKWLTENYCEGTVSVASGRCEYKFSDETNCDKACFACEVKNSDGDKVNATNAVDACVQSKLGYCKFNSDASAPNGIGYCKAKDQYKTGTSSDCDSRCGDCTYLGSPFANSSRNSAGNCLATSCYCSESKANSGGGGCKWVDDNSTATNGYCVDKGAKLCEDACDRCSSRNKCVNEGRSKLNSTGSCKWEGTDNEGSCVANIAGDVEICWDGLDNNANGQIDCGDPSCYSDSWCGFVEGDCFGWATNTSCLSNGCEWKNDTWNKAGWCDFKGSSCWKYDQNESTCGGIVHVVNETLNITEVRVAGGGVNESIVLRTANLGGGWIIGSITITNATHVNLSSNFTINYTAQTITVVNGTFIATVMTANETNISYKYYQTYSQSNCKWSNGTGAGWCERDWSVGEKCYSATNESGCFGIASCVWTNDTWCNSFGNGTDWCSTQGGWCDHTDFKPLDCWQKYDNASCAGTTGCDWKVDSYSDNHCEVNWSGNCWQYNTNASCPSTSNCIWRSDSWGGWCDNKQSECWNKYTESGCNTLGSTCTWELQYGSNSYWCHPSCYNETMAHTQNSCGEISGCFWQAESGWCEEQQSNTCYNSSMSSNQSNCEVQSGCIWNNPGWCDPKEGGFSAGAIAGGGGLGGSIGADCYKFDGNKSLCTNKSIINITCGWYPEPNPLCEVDWSTNCWQYTSIANGCNAGNGCWFDGNTGFCNNKMDECYFNQTIVNNAAACDANAFCNSTTWGTCEPTCRSIPTEGACTVSGCKWVSGWCNPEGMNDIFDDMEGGAPVPLALDNCGINSIENINQSSVDICGLGMKDMGDAYGFGINVIDFSNSSVCNKEKISSHVFDNFGGTGGGGGGGGYGAVGAQERVGDGNDSVTFFVYLDTDGSSLGGCKLSHNSSAKGYEFRFKYESVWNSSKQKAVESFNAYKCSNSKWKATDVKLSAWKKLMCSEIGGAMIAVEKSDLSRFPTLYDSTADMRVYASTIGKTGNVSNPTDTAGPGYTTPGTIDFEIVSCFDVDADFAKFEDILKKGFVQGEDCYTSADDDNDGTTNCDDWDCQFLPVCSGLGVGASGYNDTRTPKVTGARIEEYTDSALVLFDTNKPANGTLQFYGNDSRCTTLNATIKDVGITSSDVRQYKLWHKTEIYNGTIGYNLTNDTAYYYKIRACDDNNKCALSKCTKFVTATPGRCGYCNFVTRLKVPSGWSVMYDVDQNGVYEHVQGYVCGINSGLKSNYTMGRSVNIKLNNSDGTAYFEFINASLTKSGLNDKVRTLNTAGDIIGSSNTVGFTSESRDKIINNLNPEVCKVKIPLEDDAVCDALFHCDDSGENCVDRTAEATLLDSSNCVWQIPFCEFSTYKTNAATSSSPSSSSSGGGGGGGSSSKKSDSVVDDEFEDGIIERGVGEDGESEGVGGRDEIDKSSGDREDGGLGFVFWIVITFVVVLGIAGAYYIIKRNK